MQEKVAALKEHVAAEHAQLEDHVQKLRQAVLTGCALMLVLQSPPS